MSGRLLSVDPVDLVNPAGEPVGPMGTVALF